MFARDYRRIARDRLEGRWTVAILAGLVAAVLGGVLATGGIRVNVSLSRELQEHLRFSLLAAHWKRFLAQLTLCQFIIGGVIRLGYCQFLGKLHRREEARVSDLFSQFDRFGDGFVLQFLTGLYVFLWSLLFLIPGIVAAFRYAMAPFILAEHPGMRPSQAIQASKEVMTGHKWELFCLYLSFFGWMLLSAFTLGIGSLWLIPYMNSAVAAFYSEISRT